jgi:hypothetical protein
LETLTRGVGEITFHSSQYNFVFSINLSKKFLFILLFASGGGIFYSIASSHTVIKKHSSTLKEKNSKVQNCPHKAFVFTQKFYFFE